jgi:hypothetical protein
MVRLRPRTPDTDSVYYIKKLELVAVRLITADTHWMTADCKQ